MHLTIKMVLYCSRRCKEQGWTTEFLKWYYVVNNKSEEVGLLWKKDRVYKRKNTNMVTGQENKFEQWPLCSLGTGREGEYKARTSVLLCTYAVSYFLGTYTYPLYSEYC